MQLRKFRREELAQRTFQSIRTIPSLHATFGRSTRAHALDVRKQQQQLRWTDHSYLGRELLGLLRQLARHVVLFGVLQRFVDGFNAQVPRLHHQVFGLGHEAVFGVQVCGFGQGGFQRSLRFGQRLTL